MTEQAEACVESIIKYFDRQYIMLSLFIGDMPDSVDTLNQLAYAIEYLEEHGRATVLWTKYRGIHHNTLQRMIGVYDYLSVCCKHNRVSETIKTQ